MIYFRKSMYEKIQEFSHRNFNDKPMLQLKIIRNLSRNAASIHRFVDI